jgi:acetolactate synthase-1/2/3 large subunit
MVLSGAKCLMEALSHQKVSTIFGLPGGQIMPIYDALLDSGIRHVLVRHEQSAVHMADGYARASGGPGVCMATSGPGATNLVTGIANAHMDSSPVIAFTGQVSRPQIGTDAFQEADIIGITTPITKYSFQVRNVKEIARGRIRDLECIVNISRSYIEIYPALGVSLKVQRQCDVAPLQPGDGLF